jgi:pyruvate dehydrogenase E1 component alpha subunit/2-oxoisovalerate dehydrogenase E1 component alpha subunit
MPKTATAELSAKSDGLLQVLSEEGTVNPELDPHLSPDPLRTLYRAMLRLRLLDERMLALQRQGRIGFYGLSTGEEAAVIGSAYALGSKDWIFPALRQGGAALLRGLPLEQLIAQCIGNALDPQKGRQMPCHYSYKPANFVAWSSCIGTQLPHAVGVAWAAKLKGDPIVAMAYMGDGATSEGDFHVAMNFAGVYRAPVVFFCQNNQWAISVPFAQQTAAKNIAVKAEAYGFAGVRVDGNDVLAVYRASRAAVEKARSGGGPTLIEAVTYRMGGHSSSDDPTRYRDETEVKTWQKRDPIERLRRYLMQNELWSDSADEALRKALEAEIGQAIKTVEAAPPPPVESLFDDVYAEMPWHLRAQLSTLPPAESAGKRPDGR